MITIEEMRQLENNCGISKLALMENAGRGIYDVIKERFPDLKDKKILIVCYHGNNGGDGFVAARHLCDETETDVLFIGDEDRFKEEAKINYGRIERNDAVQLFFQAEDINFAEYDIIIDAMLGIGVFYEQLKEPISSTIDLINNTSAYKIAVDSPTGLNPNTGVAGDKMINADLIITFHDIKKGLNKFINKTVIVDIGIKQENLNKFS